jgi:hypothetical protein
MTGSTPGSAGRKYGPRVTGEEASPAAGAAGPHPLVDPWSAAIVVCSSLQPFLLANADKIIEPAPVVVDAVAWTVLVGGVCLAIRARTRTAPALPLALAVGVGNLSFWNFNKWLPYEPAGWGARIAGLAVWALVTALAVVLVVKLSARPWVRPFATMLFAVWLAASVGGFAVARGQAFGGDPVGRYDGPTYTFEGRPDVYWIVLDEHARSDQLERYTGADNGWFAAELEDRGFSSSESSQSAYLETHLSIPSTLSMAYTLTPGHDYHGVYQTAAAVVGGDNPVVDTFEANGYRFVYAPDGTHEWARCRASGTRVCLAPEGGALALREPRSALLRSTPVGSFDFPYAHNEVGSVVDQALALEGDAPTFLFAHVMSPHFPFRYRADCSGRDRWVEGVGLSGPERAAAYADEVTCLDREVVAAVDRIVAADPDAVVIVQSDHGSRLSFNFSTTFEEMSPASLAEGFGALNAIRLPEPCRGDPIEGQPLVNTFRLVFACLAGAEPELLPPRTFFAEFGRIETLREVPQSTFAEE